VGTPAANLDDLSQRARRILDQVNLVVADHVDQARRLLDWHQIGSPLVATEPNVVEQTLGAGDVALLAEGQSPGLSASGARLVRVAIERGFPVVPVPGPCLPITALVISGLPADSFVYLGQLPLQPAARRELLASVARERRTLVVAESPEQLSATLAELRAALGDRPLALAAASDQGVEILWRGALGEVEEAWFIEPGFGEPSPAPVVLIVGGALARAARWSEDELLAEIQARHEQGFGAKEISRELAPESGWPRRQIYRLVVDLNRPAHDELNAGV
jgi:16S rRNA (cytidine1402-2'-O)-methyltransferase